MGNQIQLLRKTLLKLLLVLYVSYLVFIWSVPAFAEIKMSGILLTAVLYHLKTKVTWSIIIFYSPLSLTYETIK